VKNKDSAGFVLRQWFCLCVAIAALLFCGNNLFSQDSQPKPTRQSSIEAFTKGDYEQAYNGFSELLTKYPKDPLYKYYSGVCLVKMNRDQGNALTLLSQALQGSAMVRTLPSDALFWLGRAQQMSGWFTEAVDSYNSFTELAGKKVARELGVDDFIQQCNLGKGKVAESKAIPEPKKEIKPEAKVQENKKVPDNNIIKGKAEKQDLPAEYDRILSEALAYQLKADSLYRIADEQKKSLEKLNYTEKTRMKAVITNTENLAASYQKKADQKYSEAQAKMNGQVSVNEKSAIQEKPPVNKAPEKRNLADSAAISDVKPVIKKDSMAVKPELVKQRKIAENPDNRASKDSVAASEVKKVVPQAVSKTMEVYSVFEIIAKPVYKPDEKTAINPKVPQGLIYRIQVAVFRNPVAPSYFKGITPVYGFKVAGTDKTNYYAGMFRRVADANKALAKIRQKGFKDAFVVALYGGKAVSSERAAILEKEWGKKPFAASFKPSPEARADTVPPTLSFRVEVMRSAKPVKPEVADGMKKIAGTRGLDTETAADGTIIYLVGKFITYESAAEYADLLTRNGYRDAKITAWLGKKEIPVDTARQLFEKE
jgi:tetratricopeptide (TPR) repeat protein